MREWVFSLSTGRFVLQLPAVLNADDIGEIKELLKIIERQISRVTEPAQPPAAGGGKQ